MRTQYKSPPDHVVQPGWPRWETAMVIATTVLRDINAEMKNCNQPVIADSHSTVHWKQAFSKMLQEALDVVDDPFFPY